MPNFFTDRYFTMFDAGPHPRARKINLVAVTADELELLHLYRNDPRSFDCLHAFSRASAIDRRNLLKLLTAAIGPCAQAQAAISKAKSG
jgi:hypothetical protein